MTTTDLHCSVIVTWSSVKRGEYISGHGAFPFETVGYVRNPTAHVLWLKITFVTHFAGAWPTIAQRTIPIGAVAISISVTSQFKALRTVDTDMILIHILYSAIFWILRRNITYIACTNWTIANPFATVASRTPITEQLEAVIAIVKQHHIPTSQR